MLKLTLNSGDYLSINDSIVVQLTRVAAGHANVAIHAPREIPVLRGAVLERLGGERPVCLDPPPKKKARYRRDRYFPWNDDREQAVREINSVIDQMAEDGASTQAAILRKQLERIIPPIWEDEIVVSSKNATP